MLITDPVIAASLSELTPARCYVMVARLAFEKRHIKSASPYECCACRMLATRHDRPCQVCGKENFRPAVPVVLR